MAPPMRSLGRGIPLLVGPSANRRSRAKTTCVGDVFNLYQPDVQNIVTLLSEQNVIVWCEE